jgi:hypothetical protein
VRDGLTQPCTAHPERVPTQRNEHVEQLRQAFFPEVAGGEAGSDVVQGERDGAVGESVGDGADLVDGVTGSEPLTNKNGAVFPRRCSSALG